MRPRQVFEKMLEHYGKQLWWPVIEEGETCPSYKPRKKLNEKQKLEICLGAILTQNTDWKNVMKALSNLAEAKMLDCSKLAKAKQSRIAALVKPSGYYNQKAKKVKAFCKHVEKNYNGKLNMLLSKSITELRPELLSLHGIGNETADDMILYAAEKPAFVVDAYTMRFTERFFGKRDLGYVEARGFFESQLPANVKLFNEFHALLVEHGKRFCKRKPLCGQCFLREYCEFPPRK